MRSSFMAMKRANRKGKGKNIMATTVKNDLWGPLALRGVLAILFGVAAVFWPGLTLVTLVYLFSGFILATGLLTLVMGLTSAYDEGNSLLGRVLTVVLGVIEIGVGVYLLRHTDVSFQTLILLIGLTFVVRGIIDVAGSLFDEGTASHKTFMIIGGILSVLAGIIILMQPVAGGVAFVWILGLYALITGPLLIALALDIKKHTEIL